jgi:hypothetical protein
MYAGAGFYGIREILLAYAKLPGFLPLPVAVQHGWMLCATTFETAGNPPEIWVASQRIASEFEAFYPKNKIRIVGSFYCYLMELLKNELPPVERSGSICIPPHSTHFTSNEYSVEDFAHKLNELGNEYRPITVMLYYLDMNSSAVNEYEKYGFKVVSNGSLFEADFLKNFVRNVFDKQHCIYSEFGSGALFAADTGLNLVHIDIESRIVNRGDKYFTDEKQMLARIKMFKENFLRSLDKEQISLELGKSYLLSPGDLRRAILRNYFTWSFVMGSAERAARGVLRPVRNRVRSLLKRMRGLAA